jgi:HD-GYP domain-containing protein (c-di-GMP phosphodiesterase class II)
LENKYNMYELVFCISNTCDLIRSEIADHHNQVAYFAANIAKVIGLSMRKQTEVYISGLMHDIGAYSTKERIELLTCESEAIHDHSLVGACLLGDFKPFYNVADIIRFHHVPWHNGDGKIFEGKNVPVSSHIIHLADRIAVLINPQKEVIGQVNDIYKIIKARSGDLFMPKLVDAFYDLMKKEYIWFNIAPYVMNLPSLMNLEPLELNLDEVVDLSAIFANIIDFRSPYTAKHSSGVAAVAEKLAELSSFTNQECKMALVAGYLHDLGNLAIKNEISEKTGALSSEEFNIIKSHVLYTYRTLCAVKNFDNISSWASTHHERLNGSGYPFHLSENTISMGSRILAIADIFTALQEDRSYRNRFELKEAVKEIEKMVNDGLLCPIIYSILLDNIEEINAAMEDFQSKAECKYNRIEKLLNRQ